MKNGLAVEFSDDLTRIKALDDGEKRVDIWGVIKILSKYSRNDLCFLKDCINFVLIYNMQN